MKVATVICSRMASTRLPGKAMLPLNGKPVIQHIIERCKKMPYEYILAIPDSDLLNYDYLNITGVYKIWTGSENDVLSRMIGAAEWLKANIVIRITGDNPIVDVENIPKFVDEFIASGCDHGIMFGHAAGLGCEVVKTDYLRYLDSKTVGIQKYREHPTLGRFEFPRDNDSYYFDIWGKPSDRDYRLTLDYPEDYQVLQAVFAACGDDVIPDQAIKFLDDNSAIAAINAHCEQIIP